MQIFKKSPWDNNPEEDENIFTYKSNKRPNNFFKNWNFNNFNSLNQGFIYITLGAALMMWLASGIYKVDEGEEAAILRFGKFVRIDKAGLNYHFPEPFETVIKEKVDKSRRIEIGYRSVNSRNFSSNSRNNQEDTGYKYASEESIMLTGDENIIDLNCDVMWRIKKLTDYTFQISNPEEVVKSTAESAIREVIGKTPISNVLSNQKQEIVEKIQALTQKTLDQYGIGIHIDNVQLLKAEPPVDVIDSYRDVQTSRADKEREINQAQAYKNDILPRARGEANKLIQEAEAYKLEVVAKAKGDAERFTAIFKEYVFQKTITRDRMYLEAIEEILKDSQKVIIPKNQILPHMAIQPTEANIKR